MVRKMAPETSHGQLLSDQAQFKAEVAAVQAGRLDSMEPVHTDDELNADPFKIERNAIAAVLIDAVLKDPETYKTAYPPYGLVQRIRNRYNALQPATLSRFNFNMQGQVIYTAFYDTLQRRFIEEDDPLMLRRQTRLKKISPDGLIGFVMPGVSAALKIPEELLHIATDGMPRSPTELIGLARNSYPTVVWMASQNLEIFFQYAHEIMTSLKIEVAGDDVARLVIPPDLKKRIKESKKQPPTTRCPALVDFGRESNALKNLFNWYLDVRAAGAALITAGQ